MMSDDPYIPIAAGHTGTTRGSTGHGGTAGNRGAGSVSHRGTTTISGLGQHRVSTAGGNLTSSNAGNRGLKTPGTAPDYPSESGPSYYPANPTAPAQPEASGQGYALDRGHPQIDESNRLKYGLEHPDSQAAKDMHLIPNSLTAEQRLEVISIVGQASQPVSFFARILDYAKAALACLGDGFNFSNFGEKHAEITAMRTAQHVYAALEANHYGPLAEKISGVKKDENGGFVAVKENGQLTGVMARETQKITNPTYLAYADQVDIGAAPSETQIAQAHKLFDADMERIYSNPSVIAAIKQYRAQLDKTPGKDEEEKRFVEGNMHSSIVALADKIMNDPTIQHGGKFKFDRETLIKELTETAEAEHRDLVAKHDGASTGTVIADANKKRYFSTDVSGHDSAAHPTPTPGATPGSGNSIS